MVYYRACRGRIATHAMCKAHPSSQGAVVVVLVKCRDNCLRSLDVVYDFGWLHGSSRCLGASPLTWGGSAWSRRWSCRLARLLGCSAVSLQMAGLATVVALSRLLFVRSRDKSGLIIGAFSKWAPRGTCIYAGAADTSTGTGRGILLAPLIAISRRSSCIIAKMCACALAIIFRVR